MNKLLEIKFGSHLYGTDTPNSDLDLKSIYLPTAREIVLQSYKPTIATTRPKREGERNNKDDVDIEMFSLDRFMQLLLEGQTVAIDVLFAPESSYTYLNAEGKALMLCIFFNREKLLNKNINAFVGYAKQQAAKYGVKGFRVAALRSSLEFFKALPKHDKLVLHEKALTWFVTENKAHGEHIQFTECKSPNGKMETHIEVCNRKFPLHATVKYVTENLQRLFDEYGHRALLAEKNEGIDWKALSHAVRVNAQAKELLLTSCVTFPRPEKDLLLAIKTGKMDYKEVAQIIETGLADLKEASEKSTLPEKPDREWADTFIYKQYSKIVKEAKDA